MVYPWEISHALEKNVYSAANNYFTYCYFCCSCLRCIYGNSYCLLDEFFLYYYILSILSFVTFVCLFVFCLDVCFVWYGWICLSSINELIFYSFIISLCLSYRTEMSAQKAVYCWVFLFVSSIHSVILFLSIGEFNPFTFRIIPDRWGFKTAIFSSVFWLL